MRTFEEISRDVEYNGLTAELVVSALELLREGLKKLARQRGLREVDAEDCIQEVYLSMLPLNGRRVQNISAYLTTTFKNKCTDFLRRKKEHQGLSKVQVELPSPSPSQKMAAMDGNRRLLNALNELTDEQFVVLQLRLRENMSIEDITAATGKTEVSIGGLLKRAKKRLREILSESDFRTLREHPELLYIAALRRPGDKQ